jgi:chromosome segregation ATPase
MSTSEPKASGAERHALVRLEGAVSRALERIRQLESQLEDSRRQSGELDQVLGQITSGELPPSSLMERMHALEAENADLRQRLTGARERVERLLAKIRFLEEQR